MLFFTLCNREIAAIWLFTLSLRTYPARPADLAADMDVNFCGAVRMIQEFVPAMEK